MQQSLSEQPGSNRQVVHHLRLTGFRNYLSQQIDIRSGTVVLHGPNGAGKTNIMEAVSLLAPGRGLRGAAKTAFGYQPPQPAQPSYNESAQWAVYAEVNSGLGYHKIGTSSHPENFDAPRRVKIDHTASSQLALADICAISWLTPQMDGLFLGSGGQRRKFLDRLAIAFDPAHAGRVNKFEKAWRQRNKLIAEPPFDEVWIASLEQVLAETGVAIMASRIQLLSDICATSEQLGGHFPSVSGYLSGQVADWLAQGLPAIDIEDRIIQMAAQNRKRGDFSMPGPHESDMCLTVLGQQAAQASTGEQKALLISTVMAHAQLQRHRLSTALIILLDDVAAHLDETRRAELFALCSELDAQIWYSGTDRSIFSALEQKAQFIAVENGRLTDNHNVAKS